jgi:hypothetical protein
MCWSRWVNVLIFFCVCFSFGAGIKPRASHVLSKCSTMELYLSPKCVNIASLVLSIFK